MRYNMRGNSRYRLPAAVILLTSLFCHGDVLAQYARSFPMPNVEGLTIAEAQTRVAAAGANAGARSARAIITARQADNRPAGRIIRQVDAVGKAMFPYMDDVGGTYGQVTFRVVVSTGPEPAPNFIGMTRQQAERFARENRVSLGFGSTVSDPKTRRDIIVKQSPAPGQAMTRRRITANLSAGYPLPDYVKQPYENARRDSLKLGFRLRQLSEPNLYYPVGLITAQNPPAGTLLPLRETITVTVSEGWPLPELVGKTEAEADTITREIRVRLNKSRQQNPRVAAGVISAQRPPANNPIPDNRVVDVTLSSGYPLPDLAGKDETEVRRIARELDFRYEISRESMPERAAGLVHRQIPDPGTLLPLRETVRLTISSGWPTPDFLTLPEKEAQVLAVDKDVPLTVAEHRRDRNAQPGIVIAQSPSPGDLLPPGQRVNLVISSGYPTPEFRDLPQSEAYRLAEEEGITLNRKSGKSTDVNAGIVMDQSPNPGTPLPQTNRVSITVSSGWPIPDFIGISEEAAHVLAADNNISLVIADPSESFDIDSGFIYTQLPQAGSTIPESRQVKVALSLGWPVAPNALGRIGTVIAEEFLSAHPEVSVKLSHRMLTFKSPGTVLGQTPAPGVKLGLNRELQLVTAGEKPPWFWPVLGLFAIATVSGTTLSARRYTKSQSAKPAVEQQAPVSDNPGGISVRVTRDPGIQTADASRQQVPETPQQIVKVKVTVDLGRQSAGPVDKEGE